MIRLVGALLLFAASAACGGINSVQCDQNSTCDLSTGGVCAVAGTGNRWCSYPEANCPSGYRYSDFQVGDGLSGVCVAPFSDAGTDAGTDASMPAAMNSCKALPHTCGASGNDDCCNSLLVNGGTYYRSFDKAADS